MTTIDTSDTPDVEELIYRPGVYLATITPAVAKALLERNKDNRPEKKNAIARYARDMREGKWRVTNQGLGFDRNGVLADGQNRLMACIEADAEFVTLVATGLDPESRDVVDVGVKRTFADVLRMHGKANSVIVGAGASLRMRYEPLAGSRPMTAASQHYTRTNHEDMLAYVNEHPMLDLAARDSWLMRKTFPRLPMSTIIAFDSLALEVDEDARSEFRNALVTGALLEPKDPRLVLRNYFMRMESTRRGGPIPMYLLGVMIKSWNDYRNGEERELIAMRDNEVMPVMDAKPGKHSWKRARDMRRKREAAEAAEKQASTA